jgi:hypothetical protein
MPTWEGIEDASSTPTRIWLWREKDEEVWQPLRKADCRALNERPTSFVLIEGGRATADPINGRIRFNFDSTPQRQLTSATWFTKEERKSKEFVLVPMSEEDATQVEELYQRGVQATSSLGEGIDKVLKEERMLQDEEHKVVVMRSGNLLSMKKKPKGWFGATTELQRGYGPYTVDGEEDEETLGPVRHLVFVIHGIGEAMWSREDVGVSSHRTGINHQRAAIQQQQVKEWKKACEKAKKTGEKEPPVPNRIELIPIEWYDQIHSSSNSIKNSLKSTTIRSIPALRAIANDVIFDVLMYLTPTFCESVLEAVTNKINDLYGVFNEVHPEFIENGGKCSLIGFSLGSVIAWDLLSILKDFSKQKNSESHGVTLTDDEPVGYQAYATMNEESDAAKTGSWGPSLPKPLAKVIPFVPEFTIFLGSPVGLFLTLRGAHKVFDEMRERAVIDAARQASEASEKETKDKEESVFTFPLTSPFVLPSEAIYNIFHPSDPVAYRIEPLLLPEATIQSNIPDPLYLVKQGQGVRLHLKAKQIGDDIRRSFAETANTWTSMINAVTEQAVSALSKAAEEENEREKGGASHLRPGELTFPLGGKSQRVDYQLQPGVIDNEYVSAVTAHSSYFSNSDIRDFLIELTTVKEEIPESLVLEGSVDEQEKTKNLAAEMKLDALLDGDLIQNDNGGNNAE